MRKNRITAEVICPSVSGKYDFVLDTEMTVGEAAGRIAEEIRAYEKADIILNDISRVMMYGDGYALPFDHSLTLGEYGVTNGSRLMLIQESSYEEQTK